jgi:hypothetical protein
MQEIKQKIEELAALIKEHKPTAANQQKFHAIRNYIALVSGVSLHESRVKPGGPQMAKKLNANVESIDKPTPIKKKQRGRPKKENVLATTNNPKTLKAKLNKNAK